MVTFLSWEVRQSDHGESIQLLGSKSDRHGDRCSVRLLLHSLFLLSPSLPFRFIDSFTPRGFIAFNDSGTGPTWNNGTKDYPINDAICSPTRNRPNDAYCALKWVRQQPWALQSRIGLMGWSMGSRLYGLHPSWSLYWRFDLLMSIQEEKQVLVSPSHPRSRNQCGPSTTPLRTARRATLMPRRLLDSPIIQTASTSRYCTTPALAFIAITGRSRAQPRALTSTCRAGPRSSPTHSLKIIGVVFI